MFPICITQAVPNIYKILKCVFSLSTGASIAAVGKPVLSPTKPVASNIPQIISIESNDTTSCTSTNLISTSKSYPALNVELAAASIRVYSLCDEVFTICKTIF